MLIQDQSSDHHIEICPDSMISLKRSQHTHVIDGSPQGFQEVDIQRPWWGLSSEQQAALRVIQEKALVLIDEAAKVIAGAIR